MQLLIDKENDRLKEVNWMVLYWRICVLWGHWVKNCVLTSAENTDRDVGTYP